MRLVRSAVVLSVAALAAAASAQTPETHVRGVLSSISGDTLTVKGPDGRPQKLKLQEKTRVSLAEKASLEAIQQGGYVGVTAVEQPGGTLRALEVHVFPESARGAGEGHRPWDLKPGTTMTNAQVSSVQASSEKGSAGSSMTNATVSGEKGAAGGAKQLELTYKDGKKTVIVPPHVPVVRLEPADRSALRPGEHVFAAGAKQPDGSILVDRMVAGKNGVRPPM